MANSATVIDLLFYVCGHESVMTLACSIANAIGKVNVHFFSF